MPFALRKIQVVQVKVEVTEGVDVTPGAADSVQLAEPGSLSWGAESPNARPDLHNQLLDEAAPGTPGAKFGELTLRFYVRGRGSAYSTTAGPEASALIQSAGMSETTGASWLYDSISVNTKSVTVYAYQGLDTNVWVKHVLLGARASRFGYSADAGGVGMFEVTLRGKYVAPTDASPTTPTYQTALPPVLGATGSWSIGAFTTGVVSQASVTIENTLAARRNANAADGLQGYAIVARRITAGVSVEAARISDYDPFAKWVAATSEALAIVHGSAANNRFKVNADKATFIEPPVYQDDNGLIRYQGTYLLSPEGTNRVKFTWD